MKPVSLVGRSARAFVLVLMCATTVSWSKQPPREPGATLEIDWATSPLDLDLRGMNGERYVLRCPPRAARVGRVVGSGPYTDISSICAAALQTGVLDERIGGAVGIEIGPGAGDYIGSTRNGIRSESLHVHWSGSFIVLPVSEAGSAAR